MSMFKWTPDLSVKVKTLDEQHQKLIAIINNLFDAMKQGKANSIVADIVKEIGDYTIYHFKEEEKLLESAGYPALAAHKAEHAKFIEKVIQYNKKLVEGKTVMMGMEIANFLKEWLVSHISGTDKKYSDLMNEKGIK